MYYVGIDPGADGGFACINEDKSEVFVSTLKNNLPAFIGNMKLYAMRKSSYTIGLEHVHARPSDARRAAFAFGRNTGILEGILKCVGLNYELVEPQAWKKEFDLIKKDKQASISKAKELFPGVSLVRTQRSTVDSDGMAEALLIAEYLRRTYERDNN